METRAAGMSIRILSDLISAIDTEAEVRDIRLGLFYTGVWTRNCGLAATLPRDVLLKEPPAVRHPGHLISKGASELVGMAYSESLPEAAINSLLEVNDKQCLELNAASLIAEKGDGKRVAIVGHFPFVPRLREVVAELWVIEKNPHQGDFTEAEAKNLIPRAEVVGITGSAFTNHTADELLKLCNPEAYVVVLGGTAPMSRVLFDYGVDAICGTRVTDPELALRCLSQGANYRQIEGVRQLTMMKEERYQYRQKSLIV
jgi:uncharacterized protein (DUF4213/DUF364 family)